MLPQLYPPRSHRILPVYVAGVLPHPPIDPKLDLFHAEDRSGRGTQRIMSTARSHRPARTVLDGPLDVVLETVCHALPTALITARGGSLQQLHHLPACALETTFGFESRLSDPRPACDFFLTATPGTRFAKYLVKRGARDDATPPELALGWYLTEVGRPGSFLSRWFSGAILEYDVVEAPANRPAPMGVFLEAHWRNDNAHPLVQSTRRREKLGNPGVMTAAMAAAVGQEESPDLRMAVETLFAALPEGAGCSHVGAFPMRDSSALRIVFSMAMRESAQFLERVGWRGSLDSLARLSRDLDPLLPRIGLACDLNAAGLSPRVGLELYRGRGWTETPPASWLVLLDYLGERGLVTPEKAQALRTWPNREMLFGSRGAMRLLSGVNHLKLTFDGPAMQAKVYIGARLFAA